MRITNQMMSTSYLNDLNKNLNHLNTLNTQLTTGKEVSKPSDNPFKTARIMQMYSDISASKQYNENIKDTINWLDTTDVALEQAGNSLQRIRELMVSAGNASYGQDEKKAIKDEINEKINEIAQILNSNYDGKYIFGGTKSSSKPVGVEKDANGNNLLVFKDASGNSFNAKGQKYTTVNGVLQLDTAVDPNCLKYINQMNSSLNVEVSNGVNMGYNVGVTSVVNFDTNKNIMTLLNDIVTNLDNNSNDILNDNLADMDKVISNINSIRGEVGAKQNRMDSAKTQNEEQKLTMTEILSKTEDIDMAEKTIELATLKSIYTASLQVSASILQKTLMDFI